MPGLRCVKFKGIYPLCQLPENWDSDVILEDLQTLSIVAIDDGLPKILEVVPNVKKLGIFEHKSLPISSTTDMTCLSELETLKCTYYRLTKTSSFLPFLIFPPSPKKLSLKKCRIPLGYMETVAGLPNLQVLKMQMYAFESTLWEATEGEFCQLHILLLEGLNLKMWIADETHYPRLEHLVIQDFSKLEEIPCEIGQIITLKMIEVQGDSLPSALDSAGKIWEEQLEMGTMLSKSSLLLHLTDHYI